MDLVTIAAAYQSIKSGKEILTAIYEAKVDFDSKPKVHEALNNLGEALDSLYILREDLFKLQDENRTLKQKLENYDSWLNKADQYELVKTTGEAVVYKYKGQPEHYACPGCFNSKLIQILQNNRTSSGKYRCTGCGSEFPIEPRKSTPSINYKNDGFI
jgi:predicted RNA-binding Zn-ribbon protein involved in translation (DUF1610 family)